MKPSLRLLATVGILTTAASAKAEPDFVGPRRDPDRAFAMSAGGVAGSVALIGAGLGASRRSNEAGTMLVILGAGSLMFTPSLGHSYGRNRIWTTGLALRLGGVASLFVTLPVGWAVALAAGCGTEDQGGCRGTYVGGAVAISGALFVAGVIHDVATVRETTRQHNSAHFTARLAPTIVPTTTGKAAAGLGLAGSF